MNRLRYALRRFGWALVVVLGVTTVTFVIAQVLPGDPARMLVGAQATAKDIAHVRRLYGLDRPIYFQYAQYCKRLVHPGARVIDKKDPEHQSCSVVGLGLHMDLGYSFHYGKPVTELLASKVPRSLELALAALFIQLLIGVTIGTVAAARRGS